MITLRRLSGTVFALNSDLIERVDSTPDTVVTLVDGKKYVVAESMTEVIAIVRTHRAEVVALSGYVRVPAVDQQGWALVAPHPEPPEPVGRRRASGTTSRPSLSVVAPATTASDRADAPDSPRTDVSARSDTSLPLAPHPEETP